jgi:hypothetical protein
MGGADGNARLTAAAAAVLTVLLIAEGLTLFGVRQLLLPHIFIGLLLVPPVLLKLGSTGWRMLSYYRHVEEYARKGPPQAFLRVLVAPILVVATVVMFATGIAAAAVGHGGLLLGLHKVSFVVWGIAFGVHFLAHALKVPPLLLGGSKVRSYLIAASLVVGLVAAIAAFPLAHHWHDQFGFGGDD